MTQPAKSGIYISASDKARGVPGKVAKGKSVAPETRAAREAIADFVNSNSTRIQGWLDEVYEKEGPKAALQCLEGFIEYHVPKLSRVEHRGETHTEVVIKWGGSE